MKQQIDALLSQNNFREAVKRFVHVFQMDELLKQKAVDVHKQSLDALVEYSKQKCEEVEDPMQRIKLPEYIMQLIVNKQE